MISGKWIRLKIFCKGEIMGLKDKWKDLNKQRSLLEIMNIISNKLIERISTILLVIFVSFPITTAFFNRVKYNLMYSQIHWYNANLVIGFFGLILLVLLLVKRKNMNTKITIKQIIKENQINYLLILFLIIVCISSLFADNYYYAIMGNPDSHGGLVSYFMYLGLFILVSRLIDDKFRYIILEVFVFCGFLITLICFINIPSIMAFLDFVKDSGNFGNSNHYGYYLVMVIMINETLLICKTNKLFKLFHLFELIFLINGLINAKSMGPLLAVIIGTIGLIIFSLIKDYKKYKIILPLTSVIIISGVISSIGTWNIMDDVFTMNNDITILKDNIILGNKSEEIDSIGSSRGKLWFFGIEKIIERPLLGYGPNNFEIEYQKAGLTNSKPHNEFIEIAGMFGLLGLLLYLIVLVILLVRFIKNFSKIDFLGLGLYCTIGAYLVSSFFGNILFTTTPLYVFIFAMCINKNNFSSYNTNK